MDASHSTPFTRDLWTDPRRCQQWMVRNVDPDFTIDKAKEVEAPNLFEPEIKPGQNARQGLERLSRDPAVINNFYNLERRIEALDDPEKRRLANKLKPYLKYVVVNVPGNDAEELYGLISSEFFTNEKEGFSIKNQEDFLNALKVFSRDLDIKSFLMPADQWTGLSWVNDTPMVSGGYVLLPFMLSDGSYDLNGTEDDYVAALSGGNATMSIVNGNAREGQEPGLTFLWNSRVRANGGGEEEPQEYVETDTFLRENMPDHNKLDHVTRSIEVLEPRGNENSVESVLALLPKNTPPHVLDFIDNHEIVLDPNPSDSRYKCSLIIFDGKSEQECAQELARRLDGSIGVKVAQQDDVIKRRESMLIERQQNDVLDSHNASSSIVAPTNNPQLPTSGGLSVFPESGE